METYLVNLDFSKDLVSVLSLEHLGELLSLGDDLGESLLDGLREGTIEWEQSS